LKQTSDVEVGYVSEAIKVLKENSERNPEHAYSLKVLGDAYYASKLPFDALEAYKGALLLAEQHAPSHIAYFRQQLERLQKAMNVSKQNLNSLLVKFL